MIDDYNFQMLQVHASIELYRVRLTYSKRIELYTLACRIEEFWIRTLKFQHWVKTPKIPLYSQVPILAFLIISWPEILLLKDKLIVGMLQIINLRFTCNLFEINDQILFGHIHNLNSNSFFNSLHTIWSDMRKIPIMKMNIPLYILVIKRLFSIDYWWK